MGRALTWIGEMDMAHAAKGLGKENTNGMNHGNNWIQLRGRIWKQQGSLKESA
jgi:hypothetical protein